MGYPNFEEENRLWKNGWKNVIGIDEAGRGSLAGPVVASAVIIRRRGLGIFKEIRDSKKLSPKKRERIFENFKNIPEIEWGIGRVSEKVIDRINILEATKLAMERALQSLERRNGNKCDFLIIDGNFNLNLNVPQKPVVKGDRKVLSCALASVFAKVIRDKAMVNYHKKYSCYGFDRHKGYSTRLHQNNIKQYGLCKIHRRSYAPCRQTLAKRRFSC